MRVKSQAKRLAYIQAAGTMFLEQGFADVTMEGIAAAVGGSKVTLYNYFSSKEELFEAFVIEVGRGKAENLTRLPILKDDARSTLAALGYAYLKLVTTPEIIALDRLIIGEARRFPELTRIFYEHGPKRTIDAIAKGIEQLNLGKPVSTQTPHALALHFKALCEATILERQLWCLDPTPSDAALRRAVKTAIQIFFDGVLPA
jgi:TetR/AcrR family transcriptional repressor of mexJK operon